MIERGRHGQNARAQIALDHVHEGLQEVGLIDRVCAHLHLGNKLFDCPPVGI